MKAWAYLIFLFAIMGCQSLAPVKNREIARDKAEGLIIPYGNDLKCDLLNSHLLYVRTRADSDFSDCAAIEHYNEVINTLQDKFPVQRRFGLFVYPIKDVKYLNGYVKPGLLFNNDYSETLAFFYLPPFSDQSFISANKAIWTHEYGHLVLNDHFRGSIGLQSQSIIDTYLSNPEGHSVSSTLKDEYERLKDELSSLERAMHNQYKDRIIRELTKDIKDNVERAYFLYRDHYVQHIELRHNLVFKKRILFLLAPYHEIFADIFADLVSRDVNTVYDGLKNTGLGREIWEKREFKDLNIDGVLDTSDPRIPHHFFTPVRFSAKKTLEDIIEKGKEQIFIERLINFIIQDIMSSMSDRLFSEFHSYDVIKKEIEEINSLSEMNAYLTKGVVNFIFIAPTDVLLTRCHSNLNECKTFITSELEKKDKGLIFTLPEPNAFNKKLLNEITRIASSL